MSRKFGVGGISKLENRQADLDEQARFALNVFSRLIQGLDVYLKALESDAPSVPSGLRYALNALAFAAPRRMPKTLHHFIQLAHKPLVEWYPMLIPETFDKTKALLYEHRLSDEAREYLLDFMDQLEISPSSAFIPQAALDNSFMRELRKRLRTEPNQQQAQELYENVRTFLVENSWVTSEELRRLDPSASKEIKVFYEEIPEFPSDVLRVCTRCGLLMWRDDGWQGIKPTYCSDHADDSPFIQDILKPSYLILYRLNEGTHLRTFIPGRLELALFELAEEMRDEYSEQLLKLERYPGIDTYDLRLTFRDEVWAVDAKDQAYPRRLAEQIQLPYNAGELAYNRAIFVIPDARLDEDGYWDALNRAIGSHPRNLEVMTFSDFRDQLEAKLKQLAKPVRRKKSNVDKTAKG